MKSQMLNGRVDVLSDKLADNRPEMPVSRLDYGSLTEPERRVMNKIHELHAKYGEDLPLEVMEANDELTWKACEIFVRYALGNLKYVVLNRIGDPHSEIDRWFFDQHFGNFICDLIECLRRVHKWPEEEKQRFHKELDDCLRGKFFRIDHQIANFRNVKKNKKEKQTCAKKHI